jgi:hypothetical protein
MLCDDYFKMKAGFETDSRQSVDRLRAGEKTFAQMKDFARHAPLICLKKFCADIRNLQLERKWNESPEWHTEQELAEAEEVRLLGERRKAKELAEIAERRKAKKAKRLLPYEIADMEEAGEAGWASEQMEPPPPAATHTPSPPKLATFSDADW